MHWKRNTVSRQGMSWGPPQNESPTGQVNYKIGKTCIFMLTPLHQCLQALLQETKGTPCAYNYGTISMF